jgi:hypothetical protein
MLFQEENVRISTIKVKRKDQLSKSNDYKMFYHQTDIVDFY